MSRALVADGADPTMADAPSSAGAEQPWPARKADDED
jgi:hypothetical protein